MFSSTTAATPRKTAQPWHPKATSPGTACNKANGSREWVWLAAVDAKRREQKQRESDEATARSGSSRAKAASQAAPEAAAAASQKIDELIVVSVIATYHHHHHPPIVELIMAGLVPSCSRCLMRPAAASSSSSAFSFASLASALPSTSYVAPTLAHHASFSTSSVASESRKRRTARLKRKSNLEQRILKVRMLDASKPDPVLGHQPNAEGEKVWQNSELARIVLDKQAVWGVEEDRRGNLVSLSDSRAQSNNPFDRVAAQDAKEIGGPVRLNFGLDSADRQLLFQDLPQVMVKDRILDSWNLGTLVRGTANQADVAAFDAEYAKVQGDETSNAHMLARVLDLRNASGKGIQVENIRRIIHHFGGEKRDTGSPEVQAAVLTYRIRNLHDHLQSNRHDNSNRRSMSALTHQRAKILRYLKSKSPQRYHDILPRIGIHPRAVEGEIVVPGKPRIARS